MAISYKPVVLYHASIARMEECHHAFEHRDHVLAAYLAGVTIECVLQAISLREGAAHDARHDLSKWLAKCPGTLQDAIKEAASGEWSTLVALWDNEIRYHSDAGFLGYIREKQANRGIAGDTDSVIREIARRLKDAADTIHKKGVTQWATSTRRS